MRIVITGWALDSYTALRRAGVIDRTTYWKVLRPDILRLRQRAEDPRFRDSHFWGPAIGRDGVDVPDGYKMKWHNVGNGNVQLRLCVAVLDGDAFLFHGYIKNSPAQDRLEAEKIKMRIQLLREGAVELMGELP